MTIVKTFGEWIYKDIHKNNYLTKLYSKLIIQYTFKQLGIEPIVDKNEINALLRFSDILSKSTNKEFASYHKNIAQNIVTILSKMYPHEEHIKLTMGSVLTNVNNYVGLWYQCPKYKSSDLLEYVVEDIIKEQHRLPKECGDEAFFNNAQKIAFNKFELHRFYSFSGPTSMGKTFLMKAFIRNKISLGEKKNFVIIVPSKALINEIKNELITDISTSLADRKYKVITSPSTITAKTEFNYIMVYTQERLLYHLKEHSKMEIDYVFVDEAQKISEVGLRSAYFYKVINEVANRNSAIRIFFACPNIPNPDIYFKLLPENKNLTSEKDVFSFSPVNQHKCILDIDSKEVRIFNDLTQTFNYIQTEIPIDIISLLRIVGKNNSNIVFCDSRNDVLDFSIKYYRECSEIENNPELESLIGDVKKEIHPDCYLIPLLKRGISYHVGYLPAAIKEKMEALYRNKVIKTIFCTSTLLEGVNLPADNLFIPVKKNSYILGKSTTFKNLIGRVGRKTYNLVGNVYIVPLLDNKQETIDRCEEIISNPVEAQILSIDQALDVKLKKQIIDNLLEGKATLDKKKMTYEVYDLARFVMNILLKSIIKQDYNNRIFLSFSDFISKEQLHKIEHKFKENTLISDDSNITVDQISTIDSEILNGNLSYPQNISYNNTKNFLLKLFKLYNWEKYESKREIGNIKNLAYYAVILNKWMYGESISQIINESINHHKDTGEIYSAKTFKKEKYIGSSEQINQIIVECLSTIENILLYSISNYFMKFSERYKFLKGISKIDNDWSEFLDFGTNDKLVIALQKIGFTREAAKIIYKHDVAYLMDDGRPYIQKLAYNIKSERVLEELEVTRVNFNELFE
jgi:hypothetical protein